MEKVLLTVAILMWCQHQDHSSCLDVIMDQLHPMTPSHLDPGDHHFMPPSIGWTVQIPHDSDVMQFLSLSIWFISLSRMSCSVTTVENFRILFLVTDTYSSIYMCHIFLICSYLGEHLGWFSILALVQLQTTQMIAHVNTTCWQFRVFPFP